MSTFAIYTYRFEQIKASGKRELIFDNFPIPYCTDEEFEKRQELFREFFKKKYSSRTANFSEGEVNLCI